MKTQQIAIIPVGKNTIEDLVQVTILNPESWLSEPAIEDLTKFISSKAFSIHGFATLLRYTRELAEAHKLCKGRLTGISTKLSKVYSEEFGMYVTEWILTDARSAEMSMDAYESTKLSTLR